MAAEQTGGREAEAPTRDAGCDRGERANGAGSAPPGYTLPSCHSVRPFSKSWTVIGAVCLYFRTRANTCRHAGLDRGVKNKQTTKKVTTPAIVTDVMSVGLYAHTHLHNGRSH